MSSCKMPTCYCIPKDNECYMRYYQLTTDMSKMTIPYGHHDYDYNLVITVINNAMLVTILKYKARVDVVVVTNILRYEKKYTRY